MGSARKPPSPRPQRPPRITWQGPPPPHLRPAPVRAPARLAPPSPVLTAQARGRERGASRDSRVAGCGAWRFCGLRSASSGGSQAEVTRRSKPSLPAPPTAWAMETQVLTPHVYWAQRHRELYLRVELSDVQVKARLPAARGIAAPGYPPPALLVCAPAVRLWAPRVGCPAFPQGRRCHRGGSARGPPPSALFLAGALGSRSRVLEAWPPARGLPEAL